MWDFKRLEAWQRSRRLVRAIYAETEQFPDAERYGLRSQLRRASNSIGANIAEASGRPGGRERAALLAYAIGSTEEVEHHLIVSTDLGFLDSKVSIDLRRELDQVRRMLKALRQRSILETRETESGIWK